MRLLHVVVGGLLVTVGALAWLTIAGVRHQPAVRVDQASAGTETAVDVRPSGEEDLGLDKALAEVLESAAANLKDTLHESIRTGRESPETIDLVRRRLNDIESEARAHRGRAGRPTAYRSRN